MNAFTHPTQRDSEIGSSERAKPKRGAGRPRGSRNKATLAREAAARAAEQEAVAELTPERVASMSSLDILRFAMRFHTAKGNLSVAAECAARLAPYEYSRMPPLPAVDTGHDERQAAQAAMAADPDPECSGIGTQQNTRQCTSGPWAPDAQARG